MLRPGFFVAGMPFNEVMTFVDNEYQIFALFNQNELHQVVAGQRSRDHARHLPRPHHQGPRRLDHLGAIAGASRRVGKPAANRVQPAAWAVPGQARRRQGGQPAVSCRRSARLLRRFTPSTSRWCTSSGKCCCASRRISTTSSSSTASAWVTEVAVMPDWLSPRVRACRRVLQPHSRLSVLTLGAGCVLKARLTRPRSRRRHCRASRCLRSGRRQARAPASWRTTGW